MAREDQGRLQDVTMEHLKLSRNQGILRVALNRPEKRNAFHPGMIRSMTEIFQSTTKDNELRAVLLTAEGESFCSGGDLEWMKSMATYTAKQNLQDADALFTMFWAIRSCPVPVVGKVFGHCFGGGAGLTAVCDIVAAESKTQFSFSEVKWGLIPAVISPFVVDRAQPAKVRAWFTTAKIFQAPEAKDGGLVNFVGAMAEVDLYLEETFKAIVNSAPQAVRETKKLVQSYSAVDWKNARPRVTKLIAKARAGKEGQQGLQAFLEKRSPRWSEPPYGSPAKI
jgi:methylglutaconyl-CoA hydratase